MRKYGYIPSSTQYPRLPLKAVDVPAHVDTRSQMPGVRNQGVLESCTAFAVTAAFMYDCVKQGLLQLRDVKHADVTSPLFVYYFERLLLGSVDRDSGSSISDSVRAITQYGVASAHTWPYPQNSAALLRNFKVHPPADAVASGLCNRAISAHSVDFADIRQVLAMGHCVNFGLRVTKGLERTGSSGIVTMGDDFVGMHALIICGYDDRAGSRTAGRFVIQNSWGAKWGDRGYMYVLESDIAQSGLDFHVVRSVCRDDCPDQPANCPPRMQLRAAGSNAKTSYELPLVIAVATLTVAIVAVLAVKSRVVA